MELCVSLRVSFRSVAVLYAGMLEFAFLYANSFFFLNCTSRTVWIPFFLYRWGNPLRIPALPRGGRAGYVGLPVWRTDLPTKTPPGANSGVWGEDRVRLAMSTRHPSPTHSTQPRGRTPSNIIICRVGARPHRHLRGGICSSCGAEGHRLHATPSSVFLGGGVGARVSRFSRWATRICKNI